MLLVVRESRNQTVYQYHPAAERACACKEFTASCRDLTIGMGHPPAQLPFSITQHDKMHAIMSSREAWDPDRAQSKIEKLQHLPGALLPVLHALQDEFGYIDEAAVPLIAETLNISKAEVHGAISFYHDFRHTPPGRHVMKMCRAEACQAMGCESVIRHVERRLGVKLGETTPDGNLTVEQVFCLGNCALSPAVMVDGEPYGRVSEQVADSLLDGVRTRA